LSTTHADFVRLTRSNEVKFFIFRKKSLKFVRFETTAKADTFERAPTNQVRNENERSMSQARIKQTNHWQAGAVAVFDWRFPYRIKTIKGRAKEFHAPPTNEARSRKIEAGRLNSKPPQRDNGAERSGHGVCARGGRGKSEKTIGSREASSPLRLPH
jgi:hypothetical protein